ncbi:MAG: hypothetical protein J5496_04515 [Lachnospiraceae bacterium]|nr:hypothetical protein [Lachnospiraceae bacterium]
MKRFSKLIALFLALVLLMSGCGSNVSGYANKVAATYGDRTIYLDEANFWLRYEQLAYSYMISYYQQYLGVTDFWGMKSGNRTQTVAESLKEEIMAQFLQTNILLDHAGEYDTALSDDENKKIDEAIAQMRTDYAESLFLESVVVISDERLHESIAQRTKALKVWQGVREQAATNVSDEDTRSFTVDYIQISASTSVTPEGQSTALTGEDLAKHLTDLLVDGKSVADLKTLYSSLTTGTVSYRWNDESTQTKAQNRLGRVLTDGQVTWQKDGESWYVVKSVSADDKDAAAEAREKLESEQKEAHFNEVYAEWAKAAKTFSVRSVFQNLPMLISQ